MNTVEAKLQAMFDDAEDTAKRIAGNADIAVHGAVTETLALLHRDLSNLREIVAGALGFQKPAAEETAKS